MLKHFFSYPNIYYRTHLYSSTEEWRIKNVRPANKQFAGRIISHFFNYRFMLIF